MGNINDSTNPTIEFTIKYEGLALGEHSIDLASLGESLQGFSKILATAGHFVATGQYVRQYSTQSVSVTTDASLRPGSIELMAIVTPVISNPLFTACAAAVLTVVVQHVLSRKDKKEMEHLAAALKQALDQNKELADNSKQLNDQLMSTINRMADGLVAASRQAVAPIGRSCKSISIIKDNETLVSAGPEFKASVAHADDEISPLQEYKGVISELDKENGNCKLTVDSNARVNGVISDPTLALPGNAYIESFVRDQLITVTAKAQIDKDGNITKLFISDGVLSTNGS